MNLTPFPSSPKNLPQLWPFADVFIVGSSLKRGGLWSEPVEPGRVAALVEAAKALRASSS